MSAGIRSSRKRIRAHANPLADDHDFPLSPQVVDWRKLFPSMDDPTVRIADVGCGFGGLLVALSPLFPQSAALGLEIRDRVVDIDRERVSKLRAEHAAGKTPTAYANINVVRTNFMKSAVNWFAQHQLDRMFVLFPDPHFKRSNHRRRVINTQLLDVYAYTIKPGGRLYTITDVHDLHQWMVKHLDAHPLFRRIDDSALIGDPCMKAIHEATEEGQKVTRLSGSKFPAVYERIADTIDD